MKSILGIAIVMDLVCALTVMVQEMKPESVEVSDANSNLGRSDFPDFNYTPEDYYVVSSRAKHLLTVYHV